jgi:hypothetical protein
LVSQQAQRLNNPSVRYNGLIWPNKTFAAHAFSLYCASILFLEMSMSLRLSALIVLFSFPYFASSLLANEIPEHTIEAMHSWPPYPKTLTQFDYSGDLLQQNWPLLTAGIQLPWPDSLLIQEMMTKFPQLSQQLIDLANQPNTHPALAPILQQNFEPLAEAVQQVWRLHYQGQYQQAYELGMSLGPAGLLPALYAKLIHTTFLIPTNHKAEKYLEVDTIMKPLLPALNNFDFLTFGDAYQKARRLELLSTAAATASGLLGPTQTALQKLHKKSPQHPLYNAMLAGIDIGVIERVGGFIGGMTYGADEDKAIKLFDKALKQEKRLAVLYNEYAQALIRLDDSDYQAKLAQLLNTCINLPVYSAEEALNQQVCADIVTNLN